jgi:hypothetical protein
VLAPSTAQRKGLRPDLSALQASERESVVRLSRSQSEVNQLALLAKSALFRRARKLVRMNGKVDIWRRVRLGRAILFRCRLLGGRPGYSSGRFLRRQLVAWIHGHVRQMNDTILVNELIDHIARVAAQ